jgi:hypothetical protein
MTARPSDPLSLYDFVHFVYFAFDLGRLGAVFTAADEGVSATNSRAGSQHL